MNIATSIRLDLLAEWRRRWRLCGVLAAMSVLLSTFLGPLLPSPRSFNVSSKDNAARRQQGLFCTTYSMLFSGPTLPPLPKDAEALRRSLKSLPYNGGNPEVDYANGTQFLCWTDEEWGFPLRCVYGWSAGSWKDGRPLASQGLVELPPLLRRWNAPPTYVPYLPIPFAVVANLAFCFALWSVPVMIPSARRAIRRALGLCPTCRYDLRGDLASGCPECGWGKPAAIPQSPGRQA